MIALICDIIPCSVHVWPLVNPDTNWKLQAARKPSESLSVGSLSFSDDEEALSSWPADPHKDTTSEMQEIAVLRSSSEVCAAHLLTIRFKLLTCMPWPQAGPLIATLCNL